MMLFYIEFLIMFTFLIFNDNKNFFLETLLSPAFRTIFGILVPWNYPHYPDTIPGTLVLVMEIVNKTIKMVYCKSRIRTLPKSRKLAFFLGRGYYYEYSKFQGWYLWFNFVNRNQIPPLEKFLKITIQKMGGLLWLFFLIFWGGF